MPAFPADALIAALPFARRYARALVGSQAGGDRLVARALAEPPTRLTDRLALYAGITRLAPWRMSRAGLAGWSARCCC